MKPLKLLLVGPVLAAALLLPLSSAISQDETTATATAGEATEHTEGTEGAAAPEAEALPAPPAVAEAAEISPRAIKGLLLDIVYTGERLVAVGERGNIVASRDGTHWAQVNVPVRATLTGMSFADKDHGWAVGHDATILRTQDGGRTWTTQAFHPELFKPFHDVLFVDSQRGYVFGAFGMFQSTGDGGATWKDVDAPAVLEEGYHLNGMIRLNDGQLLLVGESGLLGISTDGTTWDRLASPYEGSYFGAVARGDKGALIFGLRGNVYATDDVRGGQWRKINLATVSSIFGGTRMEDNSIVLVGADATVLTVLADDSVERLSTYAGVASSGTIASIARFPGGLMTAGEAGVQPYLAKWVPTAAAAVTRELETTSEFK